MYDVSLLNPPNLPAPIDAGGGSGGAPADAGTDNRPVSRCGDGRLTGEERCDIAITADQPGACPTTCPDAAECVPRALSGSACNAECVVLQPTCKGGDGCCSGNCTADNDVDCSSACGDGVVQADKGETCDEGVAADTDDDAGTGTGTGTGGEPCPTAADCEDGNPCTMDLLLGSEKNCNAMCSNVAITEAKSGDGCCPAGANSTIDSDCTAICGNAVREGNEECDGSDDCSAECKLTMTEEQRMCLEMVAATGNDCDRCSCMQCAKQQLGCRASGDATRDMHCATISACANKNDCVKTACYCANPLDLFGCSLGAAGPCRAEIDDAQMEHPNDTVSTQQDDPETAIGRAVLISDCNAMGCRDVCP